MTKQHLLQGASLVAALLLGACSTMDGFENGPMAEMDPEAVYPITVGPHMETLAVTPGPDANARIAAFAGDFMASGNGSITISAPTPDAGRQVADRLAANGVPRSRIMVGAPAQGNAVKLSYVGYGASSPPCGNWSENVAFTFDNTPTPNFGCATQHNLAAMVADPRDLVTPQPTTPPDTERRMIVIEKWRKGEPTAAQKTEQQSGNVSQVAP
jgi:pilus assembly protein CpaD